MAAICLYNHFMAHKRHTMGDGPWSPEWHDLRETRRPRLSRDPGIPTRLISVALGKLVPKGATGRKRIEEEITRAFWLLVRTRTGRSTADAKFGYRSDRATVVIKTAEGRQFESMLKGTIFADAHVPIYKWFRALGIFATAHGGISAGQLRAAIGVRNYKTALGMLNDIRETLKHAQPEEINGVVQVDEIPVRTIWSQMKTAAGGDEPRILVAVSSPGSICRPVLIRFVKDRLDCAQYLLPLMKRVTCVETPAGPDFNFLAGMHGHRIVPRSAGDGVDAMLPQCRPVATGLVAWLRRIHRRPPDLDSLQRYLDEYAFRVNVAGKGHERRALEWLLRLAAGERLDNADWRSRTPTSSSGFEL